MKTNLNYKQFNFSKGKITEATFFNQPDDTAAVLDNFRLETSGEIRRRLGIDREEAGTNQGAFSLSADSSINTFLWKSVNGEADSEFLVIQVDDVLQFYDHQKETLSTNYLGAVSVTDYRVNNNKHRVSFASGEGVLFVVGKHIEPLYVSYEDSVFTVTQLSLKVRDIDGVPDGLDNEARPKDLSVAHEYNLRNQGWPLSFEVSTEVRNPNTIEGERIQISDPVQYTKTKLGVYPSNADYIHSAKRTFPNGMNPYEPYKLEELALGNTRAARGKFILDAFSKDRVAASSSALISGTTISVPNGLFGALSVDLGALTELYGDSVVSGVQGLEVESVTERPTAVAFFSGRVFYAGKEAGSKSTRLFFSQFLTDLDKAGKCYQEQDPTAEQLNSVLATDGGVIPMPDAGDVLRIIPYRRGLLIVAENGIWFISGSPDTGFTATDFSIQKVSEETAVSADSVVLARDSLFFWGQHGIYALSLNDNGDLQAQNISETTIQSDFNQINPQARSLARGFFDRDRSEVIWAYSTDLTGDCESFNNKLLFLNLPLGAFYEYTLPTGDYPFLICPVDTSVFVSGTTEITITDSAGTPVTDSSLNPLVYESTTYSGSSTSQKYLTFVPSGGNYAVTFSLFKNTMFSDWDFYDAVDYSSELQTGWNVLEDGARDKQVKWLLMHFRRTESGFDTEGFLTPSSALARVKFDFTDTATAGRWTSEYEAYRLNTLYLDDGGDFDYSYQTVTHKKRVRGHGKGIAFSVRSSAGKDLRILGWDVEFTGRSRV